MHLHPVTPTKRPHTHSAPADDGGKFFLCVGSADGEDDVPMIGHQPPFNPGEPAPATEWYRVAKSNADQSPILLYYIRHDHGGENFDLFVRAKSTANAMMQWRRYWNKDSTSATPPKANVSGWGLE